MSRVSKLRGRTIRLLISTGLVVGMHGTSLATPNSDFCTDLFFSHAALRLEIPVVDVNLSGRELSTGWLNERSWEHLSKQSMGRSITPETQNLTPARFLQRYSIPPSAEIAFQPIHSIDRVLWSLSMATGREYYVLSASTRDGKLVAVSDIIMGRESAVVISQRVVETFLTSLLDRSVPFEIITETHVHPGRFLWFSKNSSFSDDDHFSFPITKKFIAQTLGKTAFAFESYLLFGSTETAFLRRAPRAEFHKIGYRQ